MLIVWSFLVLSLSAVRLSKIDGETGVHRSIGSPDNILIGMIYDSKSVPDSPWRSRLSVKNGFSMEKRMSQSTRRERTSPPSVN